MEYETNGVTLTWQVKNFERIEVLTTLYSPVFDVGVMRGTKWRLGVKDLLIYYFVYIKREAEDDGPEEFGLYYEFTVNTPHGTFPTEKETRAYKFKNNDECSMVINGMQISNFKTATIKCKIYELRGFISYSRHFIAQSGWKEERCIFRGVVENFSDLTDENERKTLKVISSSTGEILIRVVFFLCRRFGTRLNLGIEIIPVNQDTLVHSFKVCLLDFRHQKTKFERLEEKFSTARLLILPNVTNGYLIRNAPQYLPNDTLSLHCEVTFCKAFEYAGVERTMNELDSVAEVQQTDILSDSVGLICKEGNICDMKIQTATETFSVHAAILSEKSPVFDAMFKNKMKETIEKRVHIEDMDAETVKRMLIFVYTGTLEELKWKDAMKLYVAADKYDILSLKEKCTALLKQCISFSNFCVLLLLADMHQDENLNKAVQDYVAKSSKEVLHCYQWRDLENKHPQLAVQFTSP